MNINLKEKMNADHQCGFYMWCAGSYFTAVYSVAAAVEAAKNREFLDKMFRYYRSGYMLVVLITSDEDLDTLKAAGIQCGPEFEKDETRRVFCYFNFSRDYISKLSDDIKKDAPNASSRWV